ncbi:MAG: TatD family hydrolase [bacterium]
MLIDTHAHVNFIAYKDDGGQVLERALENGVWLINVGSQLDTSRRAIAYAEKFDKGVFASIALHPIHLKGRKIKEELDEQESLEFETQEEKFDYEKYKELALSTGSRQANPKVVAIGETGLDYYHLRQEQPEELERLKNLQKEVFKKHLQLAQELGKPVAIHCREAHQDVLEILKAAVSSKQLTAGGVVHSFSGRWSQAEEYLGMGFYLSFNGIITFARDYDRVILNMPLERLLIETDCPYLAPVPFRGKRNEPIYVKYVAEKIAELRGINFDEVAKITTENARELFKI